MNWIQNDNQNIDGVDQQAIITSSMVDILFHNVTQFWCCFNTWKLLLFRFPLHLCVCSF